jgi:hypothetical protein
VLFLDFYLFHWKTFLAILKALLGWVGLICLTLGLIGIWFSIRWIERDEKEQRLRESERQTMAVSFILKDTLNEGIAQTLKAPLKEIEVSLKETNDNIKTLIDEIRKDRNERNNKPRK